MSSVFAEYRDKVYQYRYDVDLLVSELHGGVPRDMKKAVKWIIGIATDGTSADEIKDRVQELMAEREIEALSAVEADELAEEIVSARQLNGFYRTPEGELAIRGRHVKAMIKEAANILWPKERWGPSRKGTKGFIAEHVFVPDDFIPLGRTEPDGIDQRFIHTWRGSAIGYDEVVRDVKVSFTVITDHKFTAAQWGELWVTAERNGLGAARSQGYGTFSVEGWNPIK